LEEWNDGKDEDQKEIEIPERWKNGKVEYGIKKIHPFFQHSIVPNLLEAISTRRDGGIHADQTV
jgi:hypothetical protein